MVLCKDSFFLSSPVGMCMLLSGESREVLPGCRELGRKICSWQCVAGVWQIFKGIHQKAEKGVVISSKCH